MSRPDHALFTVNGDSIILSLHIQPRASKNGVCGVQDNALKIRLTSPPVDGAANKLCREFIADLFGVSKSSVEIIAGEASRQKRVRIYSNNPELMKKIVDDIVISFCN
jgi:uncharacterized protein (TIGR00251 family)